MFVIGRLRLESLGTMKLRRTIEVATNITTLVVLLFFAGVLIQKEHCFSATTPHLWGGTKPPPLRGVQFGGADRTMLVVASPTCRYCVASIPFYRRLLERATADGAVAIAFVHPLGLEDGFQKLLAGSGLGKALRIGVDLQQLGVNQTPTLILVDRFGRASRIRTGTLPETKEEEEVLNSL